MHSLYILYARVFIELDEQKFYRLHSYFVVLKAYYLKA